MERRRGGGTLKPARRIFCKREEGSGEGGLKSSPKRRRTCSPGAAKMNPPASGCMSQKRFFCAFSSEFRKRTQLLLVVYNSLIPLALVLFFVGYSMWAIATVIRGMYSNIYGMRCAQEESYRKRTRRKSSPYRVLPLLSFSKRGRGRYKMSGVCSSVRTCSAGGEYVDSSIFALPLSLLAPPPLQTERGMLLLSFFNGQKVVQSYLMSRRPFSASQGAILPLLNGFPSKKPRGALNFFSQKEPKTDPCFGLTSSWQKWGRSEASVHASYSARFACTKGRRRQEKQRQKGTDRPTGDLRGVQSFFTLSPPPILELVCRVCRRSLEGGLPTWTRCGIARRDIL